MLPREKYRALVRLARLDPEDAAINETYREFNTILEYMERIQQLDLSQVAEEAGSSPMQIEDLRGDEAQEALKAADLARLAPEWAAGHFVVPGVIENE